MKIRDAQLKVWPVGLDGGWRILHFHVFMAHEGPGTKAARVQFQGSLEV